MGQLLQDTFGMLAEDPRLPKSKSIFDWGREKDFKERKNFRTGICALGRKTWMRKFPTLRNHLTGEDRRELPNFRRECNGGCSGDKVERIHHRGHCWTALSSQKWLSHSHSQQRVGAGCWGSGLGVRPRERTSFGCSEDILRGLERLGNIGCPRKARYCCGWDTVTPCIHRQWLWAPAATKTGKTNRSANDRIRSICRLHSQRGKCKPQSQGKCLRQQAKHCHCRPKSRGGSSHQVVSRHRCLLTPSWEPKIFLGTHDLEPIPLEECMAHLRPSLYHCRHFWYISTVALISIPLSRLSEQVSHNKP